MGVTNSGQITDLVGLFLLFKIKEKFQIINGGLYKFALSGSTNQTIERLKKILVKFFGEYNLQIIIELTFKNANVFDVILNLNNGVCYSFYKFNTTIQYIHASSNHLQSTIKVLPSRISMRISNLSVNETFFNNIVPAYNKMLEENGYKDKIR